MPTDTRPSPEEQTALDRELSAARSRLSSLRLLALLESTPAPEGTGYDNLLKAHIATVGAQASQVPQGLALQKKLTVTESVVTVLAAIEDEYEERNAAYLAAVDAERERIKAEHEGASQ